MSSDLASLCPRSQSRFLTGAIRSALLAAALSAFPLHSSHAQSPGDIDPNFKSDFTANTVGHTAYAILPVVDVDTPQTNPDTGVVSPLYSLSIAGDTGGFERALLSGVTYQPPDTLADDGVTIIRHFDTPPAFGDPNNRIVYMLQPDTFGADPNSYFAGGLFGKASDQGFPKSNIFRVTATFLLDPSFNPGQGANDYVTAILPTPSGVVVGGLFTTFNNKAHNHIVRLRDDNVGQDGAIDPNFDPNLNIDGNVLAMAQQIDPATGTPNGQILVAGLFNRVNGQTHAKLARVNVDGSLDPSFSPSIDTRVDTVTVQTDGKILIGGDFTMVNGVSALRIARLNVDGSYDSTFQAAVTQNDPDNVNPVAVYTIVLLPDGRLYVGGNFITVNGVTRRYLALLNADGSVDGSFDPHSNIINAVQVVVPSPFNADLYIGETITRKVDNAFPVNVLALYAAPPLPAGGPAAPVAAKISITPKGRVAGGADADPARNGSFTLTRDADDVSQELTVQLMVGGNARSADALIQGFPGAKAGTMITYTFAPGEATGKIMVMHRPKAKAGAKQLRLTVTDSDDGGTTYTAGDAPTALLRVLNQ